MLYDFGGIQIWIFLLKRGSKFSHIFIILFSRKREYASLLHVCTVWNYNFVIVETRTIWSCICFIIANKIKYIIFFYSRITMAYINILEKIILPPPCVTVTSCTYIFLYEIYDYTSYSKYGRSKIDKNLNI